MTYTELMAAPINIDCINKYWTNRKDQVSGQLDQEQRVAVGVSMNSNPSAVSYVCTLI